MLFLERSILIDKYGDCRRVYDTELKPHSSIKFHGIPEGITVSDIFEYHANLKYKYEYRDFWTDGYCVSTIGLNESQ